MYARLWRRNQIRWAQPMHEYLTPVLPQNTLFVAQGLRVRDWRDSPGDGVRLTHRNLKVLLHDWENGERKTLSSAEELHAYDVYKFTLAHEAAEVFPSWCRVIHLGLMPHFAKNDHNMLSDCHYHLGRSFEAERNFKAAVEAYLAADEVVPHTQALLCALRALECDDEVKDFMLAGQLREKILTRTGMGSQDPLPFNCDLKLLRKLRTQLVVYGTMIFGAEDELGRFKVV